MDDTWWVRQGQLDSHQKAVFTLPIDVDHLIKGPPGSGKTNLLLLRAKQLIGSNVPNVVVVVHTRTLQEFLRSGAPKYGIAPEKISTFHKLATDLLYGRGASVTLPKDFDARRAILVEALNAQIRAGRLAKEYSCVFVDEAQDFLPGETEILRSLGEHFFAVADSRQKIYKGEDSIVKLESEMHAVSLPFHYRNGHKICVVADGLTKAEPGEPTMVETSKYDEARLVSSVDVFHGSLGEQCIELITRIGTQLKAYPGELIGVACPRGQEVNAVVERLREEPFFEQVVVQTSEDGYEEFAPNKIVCISKLHSAKGLEFRAFHILAAESLKKFPMQRELAYMGVTRAKTSLCIYHDAQLTSCLENALSKLSDPVPLVGLDSLLEPDTVEEED